MCLISENHEHTHKNYPYYYVFYYSVIQSLRNQLVTLLLTKLYNTESTALLRTNTIIQLAMPK